MSNSGNSRGPKDKNITFDQAVDWAKKNINANREKHTWDSKFWYVVFGLIVLIIILGLVYIFYWRQKSIPVGDESILDAINQNDNNIPPVSNLTPRPPNDQQSPYNGGSFGIPSGNIINGNPPNNVSFRSPIYGQSPVMSPGGSYLPAISPEGNQKGWWFYPPKSSN